VGTSLFLIAAIFLFLSTFICYCTYMDIITKFATTILLRYSGTLKLLFQFQNLILQFLKN
jgi:hypothetical protein